MIAFKRITNLFFIFLSILVMTNTYAMEKVLPSQGCDFIHEDEYSFNSLIEVIGNQIKQEYEDRQVCDAPLSQLLGDVSHINSQIELGNKPGLTQEVYNEVYSNQLLALEQDILLLDVNGPNYQDQLSQLTFQSQSIKDLLLNNHFELELSKELYAQEKNNLMKLGLYNHAKSLFDTLKSTPTKCIDKVGGWQRVLPVILKVSSFITSGFGAGGVIAGASLSAASSLALLLKDTRVRRSLKKIERLKKIQALSCTYQSLISAGCELKRAKKFAQNKEKIIQALRSDLSESSTKEYEQYYLSLNQLPLIQDLFNTIGSMGSAVTLNVSLITEYFSAIRVRPNDIVFPPVNASNEEKSKFILEMKNRGIQVEDFNYQSGQPIPIDTQIESVKTHVELAKSKILAVVSILSENRSFLDLHAELLLRSIHLKRELNFMLKFLNDFEQKNNFPLVYSGIFLASREMLEATIDFVNIEVKEGGFEEFERNVNEKGAKLFQIMTYGSVAQITRQSVLMVPSIAFERFMRPFRAVKQFYINMDLENNSNPLHLSFTDFMVGRSLQVNVASEYKALFGSGEVFRLESYEIVKDSFEMSYKRDIKRFIRQSLKRESEVLSDFNGKTANHLCALYSPFLKKYGKKLYKKCKKSFTHIGLLDLLSEFNQKTSMKINYQNDCFYNDYKREETRQRLLIDSF